MYPILVSALASTAANLIDRWAQHATPKAQTSPVPFQQMLESAARPAPDTGTALVVRLRDELLATPEIRNALDAADPARPLTIQLAPDGTLTAQAPGQNPQTLAVTPDTADTARTLATLLGPTGTPFALK